MSSFSVQKGCLLAFKRRTAQLDPLPPRRCSIGQAGGAEMLTFTIFRHKAEPVFL
jgi:hypothetical protein